MAITWNKIIPRWGGDTIEPPEAKKDTGYIAGDKPPAKWENWLRKGTYEALDETRDVIEGIDSQLAQIPTIIDESLGGAKIRDNAGVLETLVGSVWIPILKEGDVMPILSNTITVRRACATNETVFTKIIDIQNKKGMLQSIALLGSTTDYNLSGKMIVNIKVDSVLLSVPTTSGFSTDVSLRDLQQFIGQRASGGSYVSDFGGASSLNLEFKNSLEVWAKSTETTTGLTIVALAKTE